MSLLNLIVHPDRAFIVTDSGHYGEEGVVTRLHPKSMALEHLSLVIACVGRLHPGHIAGVLRGRDKELGQGNFIAELPSIAREAFEKYKMDRGSVLAIAGYAQGSARAFGAIMAAADDPRAYRIIPKASWISPGCAAGAELLSDPSGFCPYSDAPALIDQQRRYNFGTPEWPVCGIAGDIDVVGVGADGMTFRTIGTYPATVGEKVALPAAA